ncbi:GNAT family N-acetyltransferase [Pseudoalteromonas peptidolytica]|uniref:N-acetyltransferase domain-containing protein n=2 Tax=Pseudoalteromonas TaxID=53246 RepID=A0A8I0MWR9_9GAMM|nr:GNAT family N-acetyltransferase [Pseudoalteromonas peptidolytica]MBE0346544.1 hypothetical protein [Pseudoalteromonas peptidolytica F12-50-A1]MDW7550671.1 GNAT family N-acetyltransferase [Pseudoalteromonas peptidolytica]NLR15358.1 GNAT family N-acetyltransferase [Pseudoalteromonas peptidolytica]GEK10122.1 N-acetyltransferase GCN5 [Pseudoalteromonas peptidolytica]
MGAGTFKIKNMSLAELETAVQWAQQEGWNPGVNDAYCYFHADPNGFLMGYLGDEPIATISVVKYDGGFGFLGFYIVKPEYRGRGYGIKMWHAAMQYLKSCNIGLDGVVAQQENYEKSGFKLAYRNIRYEGIGGGDKPHLTNLVSLKDISFDVLKAYEEKFFPAPRTEFLQAWIHQPNSYACGIYEEGKLFACGVIRPCHTGYKIAPLYAESPELAEQMFLALKSQVPQSSPIYLDVPEVNAAAIALAQKFRLSAVFETARMYTGQFPELPLEKVFGVTSFEIG